MKEKCYNLIFSNAVQLKECRARVLEGVKKAQALQTKRRAAQNRKVQGVTLTDLQADLSNQQRQLNRIEALLSQLATAGGSSPALGPSARRRRSSSGPLARGSLTALPGPAAAAAATAVGPPVGGVPTVRASMVAPRDRWTSTITGLRAQRRMSDMSGGGGRGAPPLAVMKEL